MIESRDVLPVARGMARVTGTALHFFRELSLVRISVAHAAGYFLEVEADFLGCNVLMWTLVAFPAINRAVRAGERETGLPVTRHGKSRGCESTWSMATLALGAAKQTGKLGLVPGNMAARALLVLDHVADSGSTARVALCAGDRGMPPLERKRTMIFCCKCGGLEIVGFMAVAALGFPTRHLMAVVAGGQCLALVLVRVTVCTLDRAIQRDVVRRAGCL